MEWKRSVNRALTRATGYELRKAGAPQPKPRPKRLVRPAGGDRLVAAPAFILCTLRSGSTLARVLLDSHSQIHAPHELHLRYVKVELTAKWSERSMRELGLDAEQLEYLLWDRVLHRDLTASGKQLIVDKTPNNVFIAERLREAWPQSKLIFLLRHPGAIARSRQALRPDHADNEANIELIRRYCDALERARQTYDGITVRYEDVTADPARETKRLCEHLGVPWEPEMLEYGKHDHGRYRSGLGDWADKIKTGQVQKPEPPPPPEQIPPPLRDACVAWGYLPPEPSAAPAAGLGQPAT